MKKAFWNRLDKTAEWIVLIGALNWGLVGLLNLDLIQFLQKTIPINYLAMVLYILVGLSAVRVIYNNLKK